MIWIKNLFPPAVVLNFGKRYINIDTWQPNVLMRLIKKALLLSWSCSTVEMFVSYYVEEYSYTATTMHCPENVGFILNIK